MKKLLTALLASLISTSAAADEVAEWAMVKEIWAGYTNGQILFKLDAPHINPKSCSSSNFYSVSAGNANTKQFLELLMSAQ